MPQKLPLWVSAKSPLREATLKGFPDKPLFPEECQGGLAGCHYRKCSQNQNCCLPELKCLPGPAPGLFCPLPEVLDSILRGWASSSFVPSLWTTSLCPPLVRCLPDLPESPHPRSLLPSMIQEHPMGGSRHLCFCDPRPTQQGDQAEKWGLSRLMSLCHQGRLKPSRSPLWSA